MTSLFKVRLSGVRRDEYQKHTLRLEARTYQDAEAQALEEIGDWDVVTVRIRDTRQLALPRWPYVSTPLVLAHE